MHDLDDLESKHLGQSGQIAKMFPRFFGGDYILEPKDKRAYYLMLEDLNPEYKMINFNEGLSLR